MSASSISREIAIRHFGARMVKGLEAKGVTIAGIQAASAWDGDKSNTGTVYQVIINEMLCIRSFSQLQVMWRSSWNAEEFASLQMEAES